MSGYRCVNYYDLCRLCTSSTGSKINIFSQEGRKKNLHQKIIESLPVMIDEKDKLPKNLCGSCLQQVEAINEFRTISLNSQTMLEGCLNSATLQNGGKVYIKDANSKITQVTHIDTIKQESVQNVTQGNDFLSTIIQAVGIQNSDDVTETRQQYPQYTVTLDGKTLKAGQISYKVEEPVQTTTTTSHSDKQAKHNSLAEFLKMKPNIKVTPISKKKDPPAPQPVQIQQPQTIRLATTTQDTSKQIKKPKYNIVLTSSPAQPKTQIIPMQTTNQQNTPKTVSIQDVKFLPSNKCYVPITIKDCNSDQQIVAQIDTKNLVLPTTYHLQMKPQITTVDGQQIVQLTPAGLPASISLAPQQSQQQHQQQHQTQNFQQQQDQTITHVLNSMDASTSTNEEIIYTTLANHQQPASITIQQVASQPQNVQTMQTMPKLQITTIPNTVTTSSHGTTVTHKPLSAITVHRINNQNVKIKTEPGVQVQTTTQQHQQVQLQTQQHQQKTQAQKVKVVTGNATTTIMKQEDVTNANQQNPSNECSTCGKSFKKKEHLAQHMKLHAGLRPFKCTEGDCNKAFSRKEHLMRHIVSHTGKKMFSCDLCQKFFSRKDNLNKHKRTHTEQGGNSGQFVCEICNKSFVVKMYYIQHKIMHEKNGQTAANSNKVKINNASPQIKNEPITEETNNHTQIITTTMQQQPQQQELQQHQPQQQQIMQLQISSPMITAADLQNSVTISQSGDQQTATTTVLKTLGTHDATVLNLPSNLANLVSINPQQFMTTGEIMGQLKMEK
ncbi:transcription factor Sp4 isoform X2 [Hermetia illucens]|uniref:transcription factor Sp4 isoform X2 n=1 Tax=Hermetia illucens TaxID=343691 RepID=UPI0018CC4BDF|nr:transcription factor Sp4 isoform X2 [Hermetia illucens]